nr:uncharacterized mitochondrial protein AtMg00810-like [Tanacetum cinerariifolium]
MVNTVRVKKFNTARPKAVVNAVKGNSSNVVKALACWVWKPKTKVLDHISKHNSTSVTLKKFNYIDAQGRSKTRIVEETLHIRFSESTPNVVGTRSNSFAGTKASDNADLKSSHNDGSKPLTDDGKKVDEDPSKQSECNDQEKEDNVNNTNNVNTVSSTINAAGTNEVNVDSGIISSELPFDPNMPALEDVSIFNFSKDDEDADAMADIKNLDTTIQEQCIGFEKLMHEKFQMSSIRELTFFLVLQVKQKKDGTFISQDKYVYEILKKFRFTEFKTASTPMETQKPLLKDEDGEEVDVHMYRSMIGSLMYLTSSRPDIMFAVCACARYHVDPKVLHLNAMKKTFSDYAGASLDRKSTKGGCQFLGCRLISWQCKKQTMVANSTTEAEYFWSTAMVKTINEGAQLYAKVDGKKIIFTESFVRRDLRLADEEGIDCLPNSTIFEQLALMGVTPLFPTMVVQNQSKLGEGSTMPIDPHHTPTILHPSSQPQKKQTPKKPIRMDTQRRVKKLKKKNKSRTHKLKRLYKVRVKSFDDKESLGKDASKQGRRIDFVDANEEITMVNVQDDVEMFDVNALDGKEVFVARQNENIIEEVVDAAQVSSTATNVTITTKEITLAQALKALKTSKPKAKRAVIQDLKSVKPKKKKDQTKLDEEATLKLQDEFDEEERLAREKEQEANIALIETWDDIQEKIDADHQLAERLQAQEQEELEDLEDLYKLVKARYGSTRSMEIMDYLLWNDLKIMLEPHVEDEVWKMQQGYKVLEWKLYDSCRVHSLMMQSMQIYMLVEKKYPLTPPTLSMMLKKKLQIDYESKMAYQLSYKDYYAIASGAEPSEAKIKYKKKVDELVTYPKKKPVQATKGTRLNSKAKVTKPDMKKQPAKKTKAKGLAILSKVALSEDEQIKLATKRSKEDFYISHASGLDEGVDTILGVPDVPPHESKSEKESWGDSKDEDDNDDDGDNEDDGDNDDDGESDDHDDERTESDSDEILNPNLTNIDQTKYEEEHVDESTRTPFDYELTDEENLNDEEDDEVIKDMYNDVNVNLGNDDVEMTDANQEKVDEPVQSSYVSSNFTSKLLNLENPSLANNEKASLMETSAPHATTIPEITSGFTTTTPPPPSFFNPLLQQQTPTITTPTFITITSVNPTVTLPEIPNFASVFKFDQRVSALESKMSELKQTDQFAEAVSSISGIVDKYLASKMKDAVNVAVQLQTDKFREKAQAENQELLNQYVNESLGAEVLVRSTNQPQMAYAVAALLPEFDLKKILIDKMEANKSINRLDTQKNLYNALFESYNYDTNIITSYGDVVLLKRGRDDQDNDEDPFAKGRKEGNLVKMLSPLKIQEEPSHIFEESGMQQDQEFVTGDNDEQTVNKEVTKADWFKKPERPPTLDPDWNLEYQKGGDSSSRYSTSMTKTKASTYELKWIEDLEPELWSPLVVNYDQHAYFGTLHWVPNTKASTDVQVTSLCLKMFTPKEESLQLPDLQS